MRAVYVVMCPNESCFSDMQVQIAEPRDEDGMTIVCTACSEPFEFHLPAGTDK